MIPDNVVYKALAEYLKKYVAAVMDHEAHEEAVRAALQVGVEWAIREERMRFGNLLAQIGERSLKGEGFDITISKSDGEEAAALRCPAQSIGETDG